MGLFKALFGKQSTPKIPSKFIPPVKDKIIKFNFIIYDPDEKIEKNVWYQKSTVKNKSFVKYSAKWGRDWKYAEDGTVKVSGISLANRANDFLMLAQLDDFKMYLEDDPSNPVNKNAKKVMASGTPNNLLVTKHIGYLPDNIANKYAGIELYIKPSSVFLPSSSDLNVGVEIYLLVRSKYKK